MEDQILDTENRQDFPQDFNQPPKSGGFWEWIAGHNLVLIMVVAVLVLSAVGALFFVRSKRNNAPAQANVILNIKGPENVSSGNEAEFRIMYSNGENSDLTNVTMEVFYPSNFKFASSEPKANSSTGQRFDLPVVRQGQSGEVKVRGKLNGATGETKEIRAKLTYGLKNFNSEFFTEASYKTTLSAPALELEITAGPIDVKNGQKTTFTVTYKNISDKPYENAGLELHYPEGFKFDSAAPAPSKDDDFWTLGTLAVGAIGKIEVTGTFVSEPGSEQQVSGDLGIVLPGGLAPQIHGSAIFKIKESTLSLGISSNPAEIAELGQTINYTLSYANYGGVGQSNVVITAKLEGPSFDLSKLKANNGIITGDTITWKSATVPNLSLLSPNQKSQVTFTIPLKNTVTTNLKNQVMKVTTGIYSDQENSPILGQTSELKLTSELGLLMSGNYVSGPLPMQVGETTSFDITISLTNLSNDLSDTTVIGSVPLPASAWANVVVPDAEKGSLSFDNNASKVRWRVGNLPAFVGKFSPVRSVTFRLNVTPSDADRGKTMTLLKGIQATGMDTFTGKEIQSTQLNQFTVGDIDDEAVDAGGTTVQ